MKNINTESTKIDQASKAAIEKADYYAEIAKDAIVKADASAEIAESAIENAKETARNNQLSQ
jgi:hypothetical protein